MIYWFSSCALIISFMLLKKNQEKQNFWCALPMAIISYECYLCLIAGILSIIHIPIDIYSVSGVNLFGIIGILIISFKKKKFQHYYIDFVDTICVVALFIIVIYVFLSRFSTELRIYFETSDPSVHLISAMNVVNNKTVGGMYFSALINGLFIESMSNFYLGELVYKSFIIQYGINFFMAGFMFWAVARRFSDKLGLRIVTFFVTLIYLMGYPYNDMIFGFVYLQMTITVICYLVALTQDYLKEGTNIWRQLWLGVSCLTVSLGYSLFAPPIYISVFILVLYKAYRENKLLTSKYLFCKQAVLQEINIFLIPVLLTIWFCFIKPRIGGGTGTNYSQALLIDGYIYRNLYSDFLLYILGAFYGIYYRVKNKKATLLDISIPIFAIYYVYFFARMLIGKCSTYYFYKLNYLFWMFILLAFAIGMNMIWKKEKILFWWQLVSIVLVFGIFISNVETKIYQKNNNFLPYSDAATFTRIYECNSLYEESNNAQMSPEFVEICEAVNKLDEINQKTIFIGYWCDFYWFEALTNQRIENILYYINAKMYATIYDMFNEGSFGQYAVIKKGCDGMGMYQELLESSKVFENDYGYIVELNSQLVEEFEERDANKWKLISNMESEDVTVEGRIDSEYFPNGINVGIIHDDAVGDAVLITPGTSIEITYEVPNEITYLNTKFEIHPWVEENSDGAVLNICVMTGGKEQNWNFEVSGQEEQKTISLKEFAGQTVTIKLYVTNHDENTDACDWIVLNDFYLIQEE